MATTNPTQTPGWLEAAAKVELPANLDRVSLPAATESKTKPRPGVVPAVAIPEPVQSSKPNFTRVGFSLSALWPSTIVLAGITIAAIVYLRPLVRPTFVLQALGVPLLAIWAGQFVRGAYRRFGYDYRLSEETLTRRRGPLYPRDEPFDLATVGTVEVQRTLIERVLGVGTVVVTPEESSKRPPIEMTGVRDPKAFAKQIEDAMTAARASRVTSVKLPVFPGSR